MSKIKEHWHEEISRGLRGGDEDYRYEEYVSEERVGEPRLIGEIMEGLIPRLRARLEECPPVDPEVEAQIARWEEWQRAKRDSGLPSWVGEMYG